MSPPEIILEESASLVPEDHIPKSYSATCAVTKEALYHYHHRSSPLLEGLSLPSEAGSKGLGNRHHGSCAICMRIREELIAFTKKYCLP